MTPILAQRLAAHRLHGSDADRPEDVVAWLGGVQAQEYGPSRWALAQRLAAPLTDAAIEVAFDAGRLIRTHVLRPTWHFVSPADLRWMLALTAPRIRGAMRAADRRLGLDADVLGRARRVLEHTLTRAVYATRAELAAALGAAGITASGQRLAHLLVHAELDAVVCSGPRRARQFTYALVDRRVPPVEAIPPDEAFARLVRRYFRSHGPATLRDFSWWCGLRVTEAKRVLEHLRAASIEADGLRYWWIEDDRGGPPVVGVRAATGPRRRPAVHLLPIYDEYTVAYRDRAIVGMAETSAGTGAARGLVFQHTLLVDGRVVGTWVPTAGAAAVDVHVETFRSLRPAERAGLARAVARYGAFRGVEAHLHLS